MRILIEDIVLMRRMPERGQGELVDPECEVIRMNGIMVKLHTDLSHMSILGEELHIGPPPDN